jgi:ArsR family transcriptional regulator
VIDQRRYTNEAIDICQYRQLSITSSATEVGHMARKREVPPMARCCPSLADARLGEVEAVERARAFAALADPARLRLLSLLASEGETCACDLVEPLGRSQPTVSHHLKVLREAGLVEGEKRGTWVWYRVVPERLAELRDLLAPRERVPA